jgi:hypothetical protein
MLKGFYRLLERLWLPKQELEVSEFVLSNELVSEALAMVAENPEVRAGGFLAAHLRRFRGFAPPEVMPGVAWKGPHLLSARAAQVNEILSELFTPDGNEFYVHPPTRYLR